MRKWSVVATAGLVVCAMGISAAAAPDVAKVVAPAEQGGGVWLAWGGHTTFHFNPDALHRFHIRIEAADGASARMPGQRGVRYESVSFPALDASGLEVNHTGRALTGIGGGSLRHAGGLVLGFDGNAADLRGFSLRASAQARTGLDVVDAHGVVWFTADHAHYGFEPDAPNVFSMSRMNLRLARHFAAALGHPEWAGQPIGGLDFRANSYTGTSLAVPLGGVCAAPYPNPPASVADVHLIWNSNADGSESGPDGIWVKRCGICTASQDGICISFDDCTQTSTTGSVVVTQDSSLQNAGTTAVPWHAKFSGVFPPYNNDQHGVLMWNLYRIGADGRIKQIGASAVKHAVYTVNDGCPCGGGNVMYPTCQDTYSNFNNDESSYLGPRSEILPNLGLWGRCGSIFDANCDGVLDNPDDGARNLYQYRLSVVESDLMPPFSSGARYFQEYRYVVRDDPTIYPSMGYREVAFAKTNDGSGNWNWNASLVGDSPAGTDFYVGAALTAWVDPTAPPPNAMNRELATSLGHARVAVRVTDLGNGTWRYEYAVANLDYAHGLIDPAHATPPNLKVDSNQGFASFSVPISPGTVVTSLRFDDLDLDPSNDWTASTTATRVAWAAPSASGALVNTLDWGTLYHFEFVANAPPTGFGSVQIVGAANASEGALPYTLDLLLPANDTIFKDGFDG